MSHYRGGPAFDDLWNRKTTIEIEGQEVDLLALEDLIGAKKTQQDRDWPMIARLLERSYLTRDETPPRGLIEFWLRELRSPELLIELATARAAVTAALAGDVSEVSLALDIEEREERRKDRENWQPLRIEIEQLRHRHRDWKS